MVNRYNVKINRMQFELFYAKIRLISEIGGDWLNYFNFLSDFSML